MTQLADEFETRGIDVLTIQETHIQGVNVIDIESSSHKTYKLYNCGNTTKSINGVGVIVNPNRSVEFEPITDRICRIVTVINDNQKLNVLSVYAPTLEVAEKNPEAREQFYSDLEAVMAKLSSRDALIIAGDFNAKTGSAYKEEIYCDTMGKYGKGEVNSNGYHLLNFAKLHGLKLTNTFFKHKPAHITTWECPDGINERIDAKSNTIRKNPYRNQIDYIITKAKYKGIQIQNSRSYSAPFSDHRLVMMTCSFKWPYSKQSKSSLKLDVQKLSDPDVRLKYQEETERLLNLTNQQTPPTSNQERWTNIVNSTKSAAEKVVGFVKSGKRKFDNTEIKELSDQQKKIKLEMENSKDNKKRDELRKKRNKTINKLHKLVKRQEQQNIERQIEEIENTKEDSTRMFKAIKDLQRSKPKENLLIKTPDGTMTADPKLQCKLIAKHFEDQFFKGAAKLPEEPGRPMTTPFDGNEIKGAIKKLKNNKSAGVDHMVAELLKYGPDILCDEIALIYNSIAETGECPTELIHGILCALQKPGKSKGPLDHLRPIVLLSMLRKILAICIKDRTIDRIDQKIPPSQAAYRRGRSTTEHVFATKILCEKASQSTDFCIYLLLLDMSKAFDSVNREQLVEDLKDILEPDEVHIIKLMLGTKLAVKCGNETSDLFLTDTGVTQGDGYSANEFTLYLANALADPANNTDHNYAAPPPPPPNDNSVDIDMDYADDLTCIDTEEERHKDKKVVMTEKLGKRDLKVNASKTEEYVVKHKGDESWKDCKLLGSKLDTTKDITRRKGLAVAAIKEKKDIFYGKQDFSTKLRVFNCYVTYVFLYNSEIWTLTDTKMASIDSFHRRLLRTAVLNIRWPARISNEDVYTITEAEPWSEIIKRRQLSWFGHLCRLPEETPAKKALAAALKPSKKPRGRPPLNWISMMTNALSKIGLSWNRACEIALDRNEWNNMIL